MTFSAERGAIPITLDKPRVLFFDASATFQLVNKYGVNFLSKAYGWEEADWKDVLPEFLLIGLQAEANEAGETLTVDQVTAAIRPWTLAPILNAIIDALRGATYVPPVKEGNAEAVPAKPPGRKPKPSTKTPTRSTLKTPSGLRLQR